MPVTPTYVALAQVTLAASAASVTLPVPAGYRDLVLVLDLQTTASVQARVRFNGDTSDGNYPSVVMSGNGSVAESFTQNGIYANAGYLTNRQLTTLNIMDYSATDKHKTVLQRITNASLTTSAPITRWASTSAITSIEVATTSDTFNAGCTFNLYGIEA